MGPAEQLVGMELPNGWRVAEKLTPGESATGASFSVGYKVQNADGRVAFMKAMDYSAAYDSDNFPEVAAAISQAYLFEKDICEACRDRHLDRVASAIDGGTMRADPKNPYTNVNYLIFALATEGDVRHFLDAGKRVDLAFTVRILHHVAVGLSQLHSAEMAHQDLKPSNVLVYSTETGSRIGDLGRAWAKAIRAPHDRKRIAGTKGYAPPELLYMDDTFGEDSRRYACDLYHLGSLITFLFCRLNMSGLLVNTLTPEHRPICWAGSFEDVLPYLRDAFAKSLEQLAMHVPERIREQMIRIVSELCEPDPTKRGHPLNRQGHTFQFSLERYITEFDVLATRLDIEARNRR